MKKIEIILYLNEQCEVIKIILYLNDIVQEKKNEIRFLDELLKHNKDRCDGNDLPTNFNY